MFIAAAWSSVGKHWLWVAQPRMTVQDRRMGLSAPGTWAGFTKVSQISVRAQYQGPLHCSAR